MVAGGADFGHRFERACLRGAAGAEGNREELRPELPELLPGLAQLQRPFRRLRRKELEAERALVLALRWHERVASGGRRQAGEHRGLLLTPYASLLTRVSSGSDPT